MGVLAGTPERGGVLYEAIDAAMDLRRGENAWSAQKAWENIVRTLGTVTMSRTAYTFLEGLHDARALDPEVRDAKANAWRIRGLRGKDTLGLLPEEGNIPAALGYSAARTAFGALPKYYDLGKAQKAAGKKATGIARAAIDAWSFETNRRLKIAKDRIEDKPALLRTYPKTVRAWRDYLSEQYPSVGKGKRMPAMVTDELADRREGIEKYAMDKPQLRALLVVLEMEARKKAATGMRAEIKNLLIGQWNAETELFHSAQQNPLINHGAP
jgi:hypothetical protein